MKVVKGVGQPGFEPSRRARLPVAGERRSDRRVMKVVKGVGQPGFEPETDGL